MAELTKDEREGFLRILEQKKVEDEKKESAAKFDKQSQGLKSAIHQEFSPIEQKTKDDVKELNKTAVDDLNKLGPDSLVGAGASAEQKELATALLNAAAKELELLKNNAIPGVASAIDKAKKHMADMIGTYAECLSGVGAARRITLVNKAITEDAYQLTKAQLRKLELLVGKVQFNKDGHPVFVNAVEQRYQEHGSVHKVGDVSKLTEQINAIAEQYKLAKQAAADAGNKAVVAQLTVCEEELAIQKKDIEASALHLRAQLHAMTKEETAMRKELQTALPVMRRATAEKQAGLLTMDAAKQYLEVFAVQEKLRGEATKELQTFDKFGKTFARRAWKLVGGEWVKKKARQLRSMVGWKFALGTAAVIATGGAVAVAVIGAQATLAALVAAGSVFALPVVGAVTTAISTTCWAAGYVLASMGLSPAMTTLLMTLYNVKGIATAIPQVYNAIGNVMMAPNNAMRAVAAAEAMRATISLASFAMSLPLEELGIASGATVSIIRGAADMFKVANTVVPNAIGQNVSGFDMISNRNFAFRAAAGVADVALGANGVMALMAAVSAGYISQNMDKVGGRVALGGTVLAIGATALAIKGVEVPGLKISSLVALADQYTKWVAETVVGSFTQGMYDANTKSLLASQVTGWTAGIHQLKNTYSVQRDKAAALAVGVDLENLGGSNLPVPMVYYVNKGQTFPTQGIMGDATRVKRLLGVNLKFEEDINNLVVNHIGINTFAVQTTVVMKNILERAWTLGFGPKEANSKVAQMVDWMYKKAWEEEKRVASETGGKQITIEEKIRIQENRKNFEIVTGLKEKFDEVMLADLTPAERTKMQESDPTFQFELLEQAKVVHTVEQNKDQLMLAQAAMAFAGYKTKAEMDTEFQSVMGDLLDLAIADKEIELNVDVQRIAVLARTKAALLNKSIAIRQSTLDVLKKNDVELMRQVEEQKRQELLVGQTYVREFEKSAMTVMNENETLVLDTMKTMARVLKLIAAPEKTATELKTKGLLPIFSSDTKTVTETTLLYKTYLQLEKLVGVNGDLKMPHELTADEVREIQKLLRRAKIKIRTQFNLSALGIIDEKDEEQEVDRISTIFKDDVKGLQQRELVEKKTNEEKLAEEKAVEVQRQKANDEKIRQDKAKEEKATMEKALEEKAREEKTRAETQKLVKERAEKERQEILKSIANENEKLEKQQQQEKERERLVKEEKERQRLAEEQKEKERLAEEQREKQRLAEERKERQRLAEEERERQRLLQEEKERQRLVDEERERQRQERLLQQEKEKQEQLLQQEKERQVKQERERQRLLQEEKEKQRLAQEEKKRQEWLVQQEKERQEREEKERVAIEKERERAAEVKQLQQQLLETEQLLTQQKEHQMRLLQERSRLLKPQPPTWVYTPEPVTQTPVTVMTLAPPSWVYTPPQQTPTVQTYTPPNWVYTPEPVTQTPAAVVTLAPPSWVYTPPQQTPAVQTHTPPNWVYMPEAALDLPAVPVGGLPALPQRLQPLRKRVNVNDAKVQEAILKKALGSRGWVKHDDLDDILQLDPNKRRAKAASATPFVVKDEPKKELASFFVNVDSGPKRVYGELLHYGK